jgi:hypothetical protein
MPVSLVEREKAIAADSNDKMLKAIPIEVLHFVIWKDKDRQVLTLLTLLPDIAVSSYNDVSYDPRKTLHTIVM